MKRRSSVKIFLLRILGVGILAMAGAGVWLYLSVGNLPDVAFLRDPGASFDIQVPDWDGRPHSFTVGPRNPDWVPMENIPSTLRNAVLAGEDFSFYYHRGVDWYEVYESFKRNFRERRFARGASTITQQLAKNLFLSREKSILRKVRELVLARRLEEALSKDRILELYLNIVELGDTVYGVGAGARHHFGGRPAQLTLRESTLLAAMLPGPRVYDPIRNPDRVINRSDHLLGVMLKGGWITEDEYLIALNMFPFGEKYQDMNGAYYEPETEPGHGADMGETADTAEGAPIPAESGTTLEPAPDRRDGIVEMPVGGGN